MPNERVQSIIGLTSPEYDDNEAAWGRNERRFAAGEDVYDDLRKFSYEEENTDAYDERKERAVWPEFSQLVVEKFVGLLFQQWPEIEFGALSAGGDGWRAEELQKNADGVGPNARSLFAFFFDGMARAMATKKRWIFAEAAVGGTGTVEDEKNGARPYLVEYSPRQVPYYRFEHGVLQAARIEYTETVLETEGGEVKEEERTVYYVMTRAGFEGFGGADAGEIDFSAGGWWQFDEDGNLIEREGTPMRGDWEKTGGEIPLCLLYYERQGPKGSRRTGITNLGRLEVNWMDQFSSLMNHAWASGSGSTAFTGVSKEQWQAVREAGLTNARWFPVPADPDGNGQVGVESVNGGEEPAAILAALERIMKQVMVVVARELTTSPDASGASRKMQHLKGNTPRLVNMAGNIEEAMVTSLNFLAQRWGQEANVTLEWKTQFDLKTTAERVSEILGLFSEVGAKAPTLFADLLVKAAESEGILPEDEEEKESMKAEIRESIEESASTAAQATALEREVFG